MKRALTIIVLAIFLSLSMPRVSLAQDQTPPDEVEPFALDFFAWLMSEPIDWVSGVLFTVVGFFGALATAYTLIGGVMPATAGQARIDEISARLKRFSERLDKLITPEPGSQEVPADTIRAVGERVENLADDLSKEL